MSAIETGLKVLDEIIAGVKAQLEALEKLRADLISRPTIDGSATDAAAEKYGAPK